MALYHPNLNPTREEREMSATETKVTRDPAQAGWNYASRNICDDPIHRGVSYHWHDEFVKPTDTGRGIAMGYCERCGEKQPKR